MLETKIPKAGAGAAPARYPSDFIRYAWGVLVYNLAVVLWGAYVRTSGSGAGCGNHWPLCNGEVTPQSPGLKTMIEFTHRASSGPIDFLLVALLVVWAWRIFPQRHPVRWGAALSMAFLFTEALIGAALVLLGHVEKNASVNRAYSLSAHLLNTLTLIAFLTLTAWWAEGHPAPASSRRPAWLAGISLGLVMLLGMTGAIAALGDTLFPVQSLAAGLAQDWDASANIFLKLRALHPLIAAGTGAWLLFYAFSSARRREDARTQAWIVIGCLAAQLSAGILNLLLLAPTWMQLVHLLLADLLWISLVLLCARMLAPPVEAL